MSDNVYSTVAKKQWWLAQGMKYDCVAALYANLNDCCNSFFHLECFSCLTAKKVIPIIVTDADIHHKANEVCSLRLQVVQKGL